MKITFNKDSFDSNHVTGAVETGFKFRHKTSIKYKLFPFNTKWNKKSFNEFVYFDGILGEIYRNIYQKDIPKDLQKSENYQLELKNLVIEKAIEKTSIQGDSEKHKFKNFITDMFFENNNLFCFSKSTLPYLSFKNENPTLKQISSFIFELFLNKVEDSTGGEDDDNNILYRLINQSLPDLNTKSIKDTGFINWNKKLIDLFQEDYNYLKKQNQSFLENVDFLIKHYYFIYVSEIAMSLDDWFNVKDHEIYFLLESESGITKNRDGYNRGWISLEKRLFTLFSHANCLELINHITINNVPIGNYTDIKEAYEKLSELDQEKLVNSIIEVREHYKNLITKPDTGWQKCEEDLKSNNKYTTLENGLEKELFEFWYIIDYQFLNTKRKKPYQDYRLWFTEFVRANFLKRRGRHGYSLKVEQDKLIFFTKLCIKDKPNIRLKNLWIELSKRGFYFDETSKTEIVKLFEKINLIEKKSDSGDAQYVRTIL